MSVEIVEVHFPTRQPLSREKFIEYLTKKGWYKDHCPMYEKWRHPCGKAPLLNLSENHLGISLVAVSEFENRCDFDVWQDIMQPESERNKTHEPRYPFVLDSDVIE